ncbi:MAG: Mur ligase family protein, partial [bacterium]
MSKLRFFLALWLAKLSQPVLKLTKHNGTNFPGELALKLCPDFLRYVAKPKTILTVTGTNGKTTVSNLICDLLERSGKRILSNRAGSNINSGIATALMNGVTLLNRAKFEMAVLEVDERSSKKIYPWVRPNYTVITNLFRDSIMRNAHPQYIADFLTTSIPPETKLILNADDLISAGVAPENARVYYGLEEMDTDVKECVNLINDIRICPKCAGELIYDYRRYHHIGRAHCARCGFTSPAYDYAGANLDRAKGTIAVRDRAGEGTYRLLSDSVFNIYNLVTVVAVGREL